MQQIQQWNGELYWARNKTSDGLTYAESIPDSWVFTDSAYSYLDLNHIKEDIDSAYLCESLLRIWRKFTTEFSAGYDGLTGDLISDNRKNNEARYGWNALKHGISGSRRFITFSRNPSSDRIFARGPASRHLKKALASPDLEPFDAYDTPMSWDIYKPL